MTSAIRWRRGTTPTSRPRSCSRTSAPDNHWLVQHHGIFQGYYYFHHSGGDRFARERYRGHPMFERTAEFCEKWDQRSFDPNYDTLPFDAFEPMMRRLLARPPFGGAVV